MHAGARPSAGESAGQAGEDVDPRAGRAEDARTTSWRVRSFEGSRGTSYSFPLGIVMTAPIQNFELDASLDV